MTDDWEEVRGWRRATRGTILARRLAVPQAERTRAAAAVHERIAAEFPELCHAAISFYWPFKGELDLRPLVSHFLDQGAEAALPVVTEKAQPMEFWSWAPRMKMARGIWNIPIPAEPAPLRPTALLVPLLGFDDAGYRLGYGGGYYDRTLATLAPRPLTIGVGFELGRLASIRPQPHDIALDAIVTEAGCRRYRYRGMGRCESSEGEDAGYASPPCFQHELAGDYLGFMPEAEAVALIDLLLDGERAGARALTAMCRSAQAREEVELLRDLAMDQGRFCAMLARHVIRLGGTPSPSTGEFYGDVLGQESFAARIDLLERGQARVVRALREALPRIGDAALHRDLMEMLQVHEANILRCATLR